MRLKGTRLLEKVCGVALAVTRQKMKEGLLRVFSSSEELFSYNDQSRTPRLAIQLVIGYN